MRFPLMLLFIVATISLTAQPCTEYASRTKDNAGADMYAFNNYIDIFDETKQFVVYGFLWNGNVVIVLDITMVSACVSEEDVISMQFTDGLRVSLKNNLQNCNRQVVIILNRDQSALRFLSEKTLKSVSVESVTTIHAISSINKETANQIKWSVKCLTAFIQAETLEDVQTNSDSIQLYTEVEQAPEFPGGFDAMWYFITKNLKDIKSKTGPVKLLISFIIDKSGAVTDPQIIRSVSNEIDEEGMRIIKLMPRWKPGFQNRRPVSVRYVLPLTFD